MNGIAIALIAVLILLTGVVSNDLGLTHTVVNLDPDILDPTSQEEEGGFLGIVFTVIAPLTWAFNAGAAIFQMATFQVEGIPPLVSTAILTVIGFYFLYIVLRLIRGGG